MARRDDETTTIESEQAIQTVLDALDDPDCRAILDATSDETLTAKELSASCDIPLSTVYRKVDTLAETGLLEERTRIRASGSHTSEYARLVEDIHVSIDDDCGLSLGLSCRPSLRPTPRFAPINAD